MVFDDGSSFIGLLGLPRRRSGDRPARAVRREHQPDRTSRSSGSRRATPTRTSRFSISTSATGSRPSGGIASPRRRRGDSPMHSRSCSRSPTRGWSRCTSSCHCRRWRTTSSSPTSCAPCSCEPRRRRPDASATTLRGLQGLAHNLPLVLSFEPAAIPIGGTQAITDALISAGHEAGRRVPHASRGRSRARARRPCDGDPAGRRLPDLGRRRRQRRSASRRPCCGCWPMSRSHRGSSSGSATSTTTAVSCGGPTSRCTSRLQYAAAADEPRHRSATAPVLGTQGPRPLRDALQGGDLPGGHGEADVRPHLVRHLLGSGPRTRGQAHHRRRGVRRAHPALRQGAVAGHRAALRHSADRALGALRPEHDSPTT